MITVIVDEAYAFDMISVLDVKKKNSSKDELNFELMAQHIMTQIGRDLFERIMKSQIYQEMIEINQKIYDLIDMIRNTSTNDTFFDARVIDDANTERYRLKKRLQNQFFMSELAENKTKL